MQTSPQILLFAGIALTLIPIGVALGTSYVKVSIVMSLLRQGLGTQQSPSNVVVAALSLALSAVIMHPVVDQVWLNISQINASQLEKKSIKEIGTTVGAALEPWRRFLKQHAGQNELATLLALSQSGEGLVKNSQEPIFEAPVSLLATAFLITEIKEAFCMGFILLVPFLVIDLIVANVAVGLGLTMLNPTMVTLPLKLLLFFCADGWLALSRGIVRSYGVAG